MHQQTKRLMPFKCLTIVEKDRQQDIAQIWYSVHKKHRIEVSALIRPEISQVKTSIVAQIQSASNTQTPLQVVPGCGPVR